MTSRPVKSSIMTCEHRTFVWTACMQLISIELLTNSLATDSRWKETSPGIWTGVMGGFVWKLKQNKDEIHYIAFRDSPNHCKSSVPLSTDSQIVGSRHGLTKKLRKISSPQSIGQHAVQKLPNHDADTGRLNIEMEDPVLCSRLEVGHTESTANQITDHNSELQESRLVEILTDYFQLDVNLSELYRKWCSVDPYFEKLSKHFGGIRILRQDPVETLFAFICSSNNNISRISSMVDKLCLHYGERIANVEQTQYYSFPSISSLAGSGLEEKLRALGFGYRAKYINATAKYIMTNHDEQWLHHLRRIPYKEAKNELTKLVGVGAKVADCVCLMSLDKVGAVPVDTHVWQFTAKNYLPKLNQSKSLTDRLYGEIGDYFRALWGPYAGWAHSVLFTADLKKFKGTEKVKKEMEHPRKETKKRSKNMPDSRPPKRKVDLHVPKVCPK
ncbi:hypothetical protein ScPMuIL_009865 [Solemya velum]